MGVTLIYIAPQSQEAMETKIALAEAGFPTVHFENVEKAAEFNRQRGKLPILFESEFTEVMKSLEREFITVKLDRNADWEEFLKDLKRLV